MSQISLFNLVGGQIKVQQCTACPLADNKLLYTNKMDGVGPLNPTFMFAGFAPGQEDDQLGKPMTGKNGRLFQDLLQEARIDFKSVYTTNCLKCAPYETEPKTGHWLACKSHLKAEIDKVKPKAIVAMGAQAMSWLTGQSGIKKLRRKGMPCLLAPELLVFPIIQPAQLFHAEERDKAKIRQSMVEDLKWLRERGEQGLLAKAEDIVTDYKMARTVAEVYEFCEELSKYSTLSCDLETARTDFSTGKLFPDSDGVIVAIGFSAGTGHARVIPLYAVGLTTLFFWTDQDLQEHILPLVRSLLKSKILFGANFVQFDQKWIRFFFGIERLNIDFDTQYAHYLIDENELHGLEELAMTYTTMPPWKKTFSVKDIEKCGSYLFKDVDAPWRIRKALEEELTTNQRNLLMNVSIPLGHELMEIEYRGVKMDIKKLEDLSESFTKQIDEHTAAARALPQIKAYEVTENTTLNLQSPKQLAVVLFDYLKLPEISGRSTSKPVLHALREEPFVKHLQAVRSISKLHGTYVEGMQVRMGKDFRIHTTYKQETVTGRLKSSDPNLQNIPRKKTATKYAPDGAKIKECFIPEEGFVLLAADYSQIELRVLAMHAKDPTLVQAYRQGADIHKFVASQVYGVPLDLVSEDQRTAAKTVNFGIIFGRSLDSIIEQFIDAAVEQAELRGGYFSLDQIKAQATKDAREFWEGHHQQMPGVWRYMDVQAELIKRTKRQITFFGRERRYETVNKRAERQAYNFPIQSDAAELTIRSIIKLGKAFRALELNAHIVLTVYDSIVVEVQEDQMWEVATVMKKIMEGWDYPFINVPIVADFEAGYSWGKMRKIDVVSRTVAA